MHVGCWGRAPNCSSVGPGERLPLVLGRLQYGCHGGTLGCSPVGADQWMRLERIYLPLCCFKRTLAVLQWVIANGCPWDPHAIQAAERNGHGDVVEWARANGGS